jgi:acetoin utilization deacetylase AcuC-like enzyme
MISLFFFLSFLQAFSFTHRVLTLSIHRHEPGFFPGTGGVQDIGFGRGRFHAANLPLREGVDDAMFTHVFDRIFQRAAHNFRPDVIVVQVGSGLFQVNAIRASFFTGGFKWTVSRDGFGF